MVCLLCSIVSLLLYEEGLFVCTGVWGVGWEREIERDRERSREIERERERERKDEEKCGAKKKWMRIMTMNYKPHTVVK